MQQPHKLIPVVIDEREFAVLVDALALAERFYSFGWRKGYEEAQELDGIAQLSARLHDAADSVANTNDTQT